MCVRVARSFNIHRQATNKGTNKVSANNQLAYSSAHKHTHTACSNAKSSRSTMTNGMSVVQRRCRRQRPPRGTSLARDREAAAEALARAPASLLR